mgnify:CR=1 FL=1
MIPQTQEGPSVAQARLAGVLYLIIILCAGFSEGYVRGGVIVSGDAAATAANIRASEWLFRIGFTTDLLAFLSDVALAVLFYVLLRPVTANHSRRSSSASACFSAPAILGMPAVPPPARRCLLPASLASGLAGKSLEFRQQPSCPIPGC